jgi:hypothetical protein
VMTPEQLKEIEKRQDGPEIQELKALKEGE